MGVTTVSGAFIYYGIRLVVFTACAALGIFVGIKLRKAKNKKEQAESISQD